MLVMPSLSFAYGSGTCNRIAINIIAINRTAINRIAINGMALQTRGAVLLLIIIHNVLFMCYISCIVYI